MVKLYELMVVLPGNIGQDQVKTFISAIEKLAAAKGGKVDSHEMLGKRTLAYEIKKQREGYYVLFVISLDASVAQAFEREVRLMDDVLRHLFILYEEKIATPSMPESGTVEDGKSEE
jgi:small subunit ribosomal protein S6